MVKNQYFGDVNDYRKYGILRILRQRGPLTVAVDWLLTPDDDRPDGRRIDYLRDPKRWRRYDPELYDTLREAVLGRGIRTVAAFEDSGLLPGAVYANEAVPTGVAARLEAFARVLRTARGTDLLFFDPDNGLEARSVPLGRPASPKYLYRHEVGVALAAGHSLLIYQHYRRERREPFVKRLAGNLGSLPGVAAVWSLRTSHVVFFVVGLSRHRAALKRALTALERAWPGQIVVQRHGGERAGTGGKP